MIVVIYFKKLIYAEENRPSILANQSTIFILKNTTNSRNAIRFLQGSRVLPKTELSINSTKERHTYISYKD